jgi:hypothetical protein
MYHEIDCIHVQDLLPQFATGALRESEHRQVEAHLARCASCPAALAEWRAIIADLREEVAELPLDTALEQNWTVLRARLTPQPDVLEPVTGHVSHTPQSGVDRPVVLVPLASTRNPIYQRWLGLVSAAAVAFLTLASLALFGALHYNRTIRNQRPTGTTAISSASGCENVKPSGDKLEQYTALNALSFVSPDDGWATGLQYNASHSQPFYGVIYHLQDCHWRRFPIALPKIGLDSISMVSADGGWAAGSRTKTGQWALSDLQALVVYHYQYGQWEQVTVPGSAAYVSGEIAMQSQSEGWLIGQGPNNLPNGLLHYQNGLWSPVALPAGIVGGLDGPLVPVAVHDVWFQSDGPTNADGSFTDSLVHDRDGQITTYPLPPDIFVSGLAFPSSSDGWLAGVVGNTLVRTTRQQPVLMHFDGRHWQKVPLPATLLAEYSDNYFTGISLASGQEGFITGYSDTPADSSAPLLFYRLHRGQWQVYVLPADQRLANAASGTIDMVSATEGWAFTRQVTGMQGAFRTTILHFSHGQWTVFAQ